MFLTPLMGLEHENTLTLSWGGIWQEDQYLSPLKYSNHYLSIQNQWRQPLLSKQKDSLCLWTHTGTLRIEGQRLYSPQYTNMMYGLLLEGGWGAEYNFNHLIGVRGFNLFLGPYLDALFCARQHATNVNKPFSFDIILQTYARLGVAYAFAHKQTSYRIGYTAQLGLLGCMFIPEYGQSYYEISQGVSHGDFHFASLNNCIQFRQRLCFDMQFKRSAWTIGVEHFYGNQHANSLLFSRQQVAIVIGTIFTSKTTVRKFDY